MVAQKTLNLEIKETYNKLETLLAKNKCRIIAESKPSGVSVIQGSLWGTSPQAAQKRTTYSLAQDTKETSITATSKLTKGYINLTLIGCVFSLVLLAVCVWIALNLQSYVAVGEVGFWGWLAQIGVHIDMDKAAIFIWLTWILSAFLAATLIVEAFIVWKVYSKIDVFSQEILNALEL